MSNMGYWPTYRFQNTLSDLRDCYDNAEDTPESEEEQQARVRLIKLCMTISEEFSWVVEEAERAKKNEPPRGLTRKPSDPLYDTDCPTCKGQKRVQKTFRSGCCGNRTMLVKCPSCRGTGRRKE